MRESFARCYRELTRHWRCQIMQWGSSKITRSFFLVQGKAKWGSKCSRKQKRSSVSLRLWGWKFIRCFSTFSLKRLTRLPRCLRSHCHQLPCSLHGWFQYPISAPRAVSWNCWNMAYIAEGKAVIPWKTEPNISKKFPKFWGYLAQRF